MTQSLSTFECRRNRCGAGINLSAVKILKDIGSIKSGFVCLERYTNLNPGNMLRVAIP